MKEQDIFSSQVFPVSYSSLQQTEPDGTKTCILTKTGKAVNGLAVDWESGLIYFSSQGDKTIEVVRLDGQFRHVVLNWHNGLDDPSALAVWPGKG